ncbi:UdgX family uracil-DNA binding protein [Actibacterium ureilyticum]|uniref:UdgX family uracil-DNA binding protein n=1 Tax=Actibacterium ureilyticum TaxID=1590614 RepID=UPI000BAA9FD7|nr:UdgX family uracil-DNA binding protein [Actibacterium ureilyticum]
MYRVTLPALGTFDAWRDAARRLLSHGVPPDGVLWQRDGAGGGDLFAADAPPDTVGPQKVATTRTLLSTAQSVICHRDGQAPALLYQALHRHQSDRRAMANPADPLTRKLMRLQKEIGRDIHKMHAFVRFRELPASGPRRRFGAWFEPDHAIVEIATPFFARRFADMDWTIATPQGVARFQDSTLDFHPPGPPPDLPDDASEGLWQTYFAHIFNPARIHLKAMRSEMPLKYWKNMPETRLIPDMLAAAESRVAEMRAAMPSQPPARSARILNRLATPEPSQTPATMGAARAAAAQCRRCGLREAATQTVWGAGDAAAALMIVGEQPGDAEDLAGRPFVGPAGQVLDAAMTEAATGPCWRTNAVKHFKFKPRGKRRIHQPPTQGEIDHCRWWLDLERDMIKPRVTVALGASAAYALTGNAAPLAPRRGGIEPARDGGPVVITWHPSYVLRLDDAAATTARTQMVADLRRAQAMLQAAG